MSATRNASPAVAVRGSGNAATKRALAMGRRMSAVVSIWLVLRPESHLVPRAAASLRHAASSVAPISRFDMGAPCVLAWLAFRAPEHLGASGTEHYRTATKTTTRARTAS